MHPKCLTPKIESPQYHARQYPILARMARDYLAIQGSSVPSERAFSSGGLTGTLLRNNLTPEAFEALQILKSGYKHGIMAAHEVQEHSSTDLKASEA